MKYIQLRVEDNIHKNITVRAISIGVSIQEYILERVFNHRYDEVPKPTKEPKLSIKEIAKKPMLFLKRLQKSYAKNGVLFTKTLTLWVFKRT